MTGEPWLQVLVAPAPYWVSIASGWFDPVEAGAEATDGEEYEEEEGAEEAEGEEEGAEEYEEEEGADEGEE